MNDANPTGGGTPVTSRLRDELFALPRATRRHRLRRLFTAATCEELHGLRQMLAETEEAMRTAPPQDRIAAERTISLCRDVLDIFGMENV